MVYVRTTRNDPVIYRKEVLSRCFCFNFQIWVKNSTKMLKRKSIFPFFRYSLALLQKTKNVLLYQEQLFGFLYMCEAIAEKWEFPFPFEHFSTVFDSNLKIEAKTPRKNFFSIYMTGSLRVVLTYTIAFYIYQRVFKAHKLNMKKFLIIPPWPTVHRTT